jgi:hypothetical protein
MIKDAVRQVLRADIAERALAWLDQQALDQALRSQRNAGRGAGNGPALYYCAEVSTSVIGWVAGPTQTARRRMAAPKAIQSSREAPDRIHLQLVGVISASFPTHQQIDRCDHNDGDDDG